MRRLYLIRHAAPDIPPGTKVCLGRTDTPLGPLGRMQACQLGEVFRGVPLTAVFTSPLSRAVQTARRLSHPPVPLAGLEELDAGDWDGLDFAEIRARWPEHYAARGRDLHLPPPRGEDAAAGGRRFLAAVRAALERSAGDIALVAHRSVNQTLVCHTLRVSPFEGRRYPMPYCSWCVFAVDGSGFHLEELARTARPHLTAALAERLLEAAAPPERVRAHCRAVAAEAERIATALPLPLDRELLAGAALLHDVARTLPRHPAAGGEWLRALGYDGAAALVEQHHDLEETELREAAILYLADKCIQGTVRVSVEERFARSGERCQTEEARAAWSARLANARRARDQVNRLCGRTVVP